jgi:hypothetical protein
MFSSSESWDFNSTHVYGTHVPVEEPSTASKADSCSAANWGELPASPGH